MTAVRAILIGLSVLFVVSALVPALGRRQWWVRAFEFPRAQLAAIGLILWVATLVRLWPLDGREGSLVALVAAAVVYQLWQIVRYTPLAPVTVPLARHPVRERSLRVLTANVYQDNRDAARFLALAESADADLVLAVETDSRWQDELAPLAERYPYGVFQPQSNTYGMLLFSRLELLEPVVRFLIEDDVPSIRTGVRLPSGDVIQLYCLHPRPPAPQEAAVSVERDAELLLVAQEIRDRRRPTVVLGDLNDVAWSYTTSRMQRLGGLLDPRVGRGRFSTFPARWPLMRWPLDHVFHTAELALLGLRRLPAFGSDHLAVYAGLQLSPAAPVAQDEPEPNGNDAAVLREVVEEARGNEAGAGD